MSWFLTRSENKTEVNIISTDDSLFPPPHHGKFIKGNEAILSKTLSVSYTAES